MFSFFVASERQAPEKCPEDLRPAWRSVVGRARAGSFDPLLEADELGAERAAGRAFPGLQARPGAAPGPPVPGGCGSSKRELERGELILMAGVRGSPPARRAGERRKRPSRSRRHTSC